MVARGDAVGDGARRAVMAAATATGNFVATAALGVRAVGAALDGVGARAGDALRDAAGDATALGVGAAAALGVEAAAALGVGAAAAFGDRVVAALGVGAGLEGRRA